MVCKLVCENYFFLNDLTDVCSDGRKIFAFITECYVVKSNCVFSVCEEVNTEVVYLCEVGRTACFLSFPEVKLKLVPTGYDFICKGVVVVLLLVTSAGRGNFDLTVACESVSVFYKETNIESV